MKYLCLQCGLVYDADVGRPEDGIPKDTAFTDLPDDWECPFCGSAKDHFEQEEGE
jgi:rubredoxin